MEEHREWFEKAENDLKAANYNHDGGLFDISAFLSQQAIEKALKALSLKKFKKINKVHDLVTLGKNVGLPVKFLNYCKEITAAYIYTRYPDIPKIENLEVTAKDFINQAEEILEWTRRLL